MIDYGNHLSMTDVAILVGISFRDRGDARARKIFLHDAEEPFLLRVIRVKVVFGYLNCLVQTDFPITAGISFRNRGRCTDQKGVSV